ncbi:MAG: ABC transporter [Desulfobulbus propionicus]|nr:MAG: ABC transporter [Desulfobulbus propionicus]
MNKETIEKGKKLVIIRGLRADDLVIDNFTARAGEGWCCIGNNTSGVDSLGEIFAGEILPSSSSQMILPDDTGVITFAKQQSWFEEELRLDDTDYMNRLDPGTPAINYLSEPEQFDDLIESCNMKSVLAKGFRQLSSGQARKLCLLAEVTKKVRCLIVQNPYEGIDTQSCHDINRMFAALIKSGVLLIVTINNADDFPAWCTHIAIVQNGRMTMAGQADRKTAALVFANIKKSGDIRVAVDELHRERQEQYPAEKVLVRLRGGIGGYGEEIIFSGVDLSIAEGEHTLITGPNGCGKSTLVHLITGDHPWSYKNDIQVFGIQRGTGESIWELKRQMGIVSSELHRNHFIAGSCLQVVVSGLFDSIGLYKMPTGEQLKRGEKWLERLGMAHMSTKPFRRQSFARQRLLLIGRALIKVPRLLVLDEPTLGLDQGNRTALLKLLAEIAGENLCTLLYVSHRHDEYRSFFRQHVAM